MCFFFPLVFCLAFTGNITWYTSIRTVLFLCGTDSSRCWAHVLDVIDEMMMMNDEILNMTSFFRKLNYTFLVFCFEFSNQICFCLYNLLFVSFAVLNLAYKQCRSKWGFFKSTRNTTRRVILKAKKLCDIDVQEVSTWSLSFDSSVLRLCVSREMLPPWGYLRNSGQ